MTPRAQVHDVRATNLTLDVIEDALVEVTYQGTGDEASAKRAAEAERVLGVVKGWRA